MCGSLQHTLSMWLDWKWGISQKMRFQDLDLPCSWGALCAQKSGLTRGKLSQRNTAACVSPAGILVEDIKFASLFPGMLSINIKQSPNKIRVKWNRDLRYNVLQTNVSGRRLMEQHKIHSSHHTRIWKVKIFFRSRWESPERWWGMAGINPTLHVRVEGTKLQYNLGTIFSLRCEK